MGFEIENGILKKYTEEDGVTEVVIPDGVTSIGEEAFYECESLTSVIIPDSVTSIGDSAFVFCENLTAAIIPDSVTSIGDDAFAFCDSLTAATIPDNVTSIGDSVFEACGSLTTVTIPDSITSIGKNVFSCCTSLKSVTFRNKEYNITVSSDFVKSDGTVNADTEIMFNFFNNKKYKNFAAIKKSEYKIPMALIWYFKYKNKIAKAYIKRNIKRVVSYLAENNNADMIYKILPLGFITKKNIDAIVDSVIENTEIRAIFLNYKRENFGE